MTKTKFELDKVYKTRDGQEARVICVDAPEPLPIVVLTLKEKPYSLWRSLWRVGADGRVDEDTDSQFDLMPPSPSRLWSGDDWHQTAHFIPVHLKPSPAKTAFGPFQARLRGPSPSAPPRSSRTEP